MRGNDVRTPTDYASALEEARTHTLQLFAALADEDLRRQVHPDFSPLGWHLGHIGVVESFWVRQQCQGQPSLSPFYDFFFTPTENPKSERMQLPSGEEILAYLRTVREQTLQFLAQTTFHTEHPLLCDGNIFSMLLQHEEQHLETALFILQLLGATRYESARRVDAEVTWGERIREQYSPASYQAATVHSPEPMARLSGGIVLMGSNDLGETLDNERPRHEVKVPAFSIDRRPITNGEFLRFVEESGYDTPSWWNVEGWQWCQRQAIRHPLYWRKLTSGHWVELDFAHASPLALEQPVRCVSWYEADAYARWVGKRLPTEAEWEYAAGTKMLHATGRVWEWTATWFHPYPGFRAHPYDGYSVPYFDRQHRVLRGGSWVTRKHVRRITFRNWYHPGMRAIFSGFRCARDEN